MLGNYNYFPELGTRGMKQRQGDFPVFMVIGIDSKGDRWTLADNLDSRQESIHRNWMINKARVMVTRFWDASTFYLVLQSHTPSLTERIPSLPKMDGKELQAEDDIEIFAGYSSNYPDLHEDIDDKVRRIFVGSIDIIARVGTDRGGHSVTIRGRDRMKWLMDTAVSYNAHADSSPGRLSVGQLTPGKENFKARSDVILEIAQRGIGHIPIIPPEERICERMISQGMIYDIHFAAKDDNDETRIDNPDFHYQLESDNDTFNKNLSLSNLDRNTFNYSVGIEEKPDPSEEGETILIADTKYDGDEVSTAKNPLFNIYVSRPGFDKVNEAVGGVGINVMDQAPIDFIKYMAQHEVYPTELFQDHINGCLYYTPRMNDNTGINSRGSEIGVIEKSEEEEEDSSIDEFREDTRFEVLTELTVEDRKPEAKERLYRTYYYRPESCIASGKTDGNDIDLRQQLFVLKEERSSLSVKTNYMVSNAAAERTKNIFIHFQSRPANWKDKNYPCYFMQIDDELINNHAEAGAIAASMARIHSRDTRSGMITVQGDPTLSPSESVQIIGGLYTQDKKAEDYTKEKDDFLDAQTVLNRSILDLQEQVFNDRLEQNKEDKEDSTSDRPNVSTPVSGVSAGGAAIRNSGEETEEEEDTSEDSKADANITSLDQGNEDLSIVGLSDDTTYTESMSDKEKLSGAKSNDLYSAQDPESIYRIEAVIHKYNDDKEGYYTEAMILSPY